MKDLWNTNPTRAVVNTAIACLQNPGPSGWAWSLQLFDNEDDELWHHFGSGYAYEAISNPQAELTAAVRALNSARRILSGIPQIPMTIHSGARYVVDGANGWLPRWKEKGWIKSDGDPVANSMLWLELDDMLSGLNARFEWRKGLAGLRYGDEVFSLAHGAALRARREIEEGQAILAEWNAA